MLRLDGIAVAKAREARLKERITHFEAKHGRKPGLAVVIVGVDPASQVYVKNKVKKTESIGMRGYHFELPEKTSEADLIDRIEALNDDPNVDGILVQLPLPKHLNTEHVLETIRSEKDADGLTTGNLGLLFAGRKRVAPCTPWGVIAILDHYEIGIEGKRAVVVGRSNLVGKPMAQLLLDRGATVTICHSKTKDLQHHTRDGEIVVVAAGRQRFLGKDAFSKDAVVIDVGMHRPAVGEFAGKLVGDVRFTELEANPAAQVAAATPVPGGVGPMTIQMLLENTVTLAELAIQERGS